MFFFESLGTGSDSKASFFCGTEPAPEIVEPPKPTQYTSNLHIYIAGCINHNVHVRLHFSARLHVSPIMHSYFIISFNLHVSWKNIMS